MVLPKGSLQSTTRAPRIQNVISTNSFVSSSSVDETQTDFIHAVQCVCRKNFKIVLICELCKSFDFSLPSRVVHGIGYIYVEKLIVKNSVRSDCGVLPKNLLDRSSFSTLEISLKFNRFEALSFHESTKPLPNKLLNEPLA